MDTSIQDNLLSWENYYSTYCEIENACMQSIGSMGEIKNNLTKLLGNQKEDDIIFYKSIIDNSYFYLNSSLKIRKVKFLKDLNSIWKLIDDRKQMDEINKNNFSLLLKDYHKMAEDINFAKKNNTVLKWVKDDKIESLRELENDMSEIMKYHVTLMTYYKKFVDLEKSFYCNDDNDIDPTINIKKTK